jgi:hypothetical protein
MGSTIRLAPGMDKSGNALREFDQTSQETIVRYSAALLDEDFIGPGHATGTGIPAHTAPAVGYPWVSLVVGAAPPTVSVVANAPNGVVACALTAASQAQEALLYANDVLNWDASKSANFETRLAMSVLPTGVAEAVFGLHAAYNAAGPDATATYIDFQLLGLPAHFIISDLTHPTRLMCFFSSTARE